MSRFCALCSMLLLAVLSCGCAANEDRVKDRLEGAEQIQYFDRNGDGKIDKEFHRYPGFFDVDWELLDDNYDGRYEKKVVHGYTLNITRVDLAVPARKVTN